MKKLFLLFFLINTSALLFGAYLENVPYQLVQPNGDTLNVFITGDEFYRRVHDKDGYSIIRSEAGWYVYALYDSARDELIPSEYIVSSVSKAVLPMQKGLGISREKYMAKRKAFFEPSSASQKSAVQSLNKRDENSTQQINNIIICIGFSDSEGMTTNFNYVNGMFNSEPGHNVRDYFYEMSYGKTEVVSHFYPPADENVLRYYMDSHPRAYYETYSAYNPIGYSGDDQRREREHTLLKNAVEWVNANYPIPTDINLDINNDGYCDYITFIVEGGVSDWADLLWPHKWSLYSESVTINGKLIWDYNFELDGAENYFNLSVFVHEGYHVLGAPDLYHYNYYTNRKAVGIYDIMDESGIYGLPQSMSAYMKYRYGNWVTDITEAEWNTTCEVYPFYTNDGSDPEKPVIIKIPSSGYMQSYVVEYRKTAGNHYDEESGMLAGGMLIYRIDERFDGNANYSPDYGEYDEIYLFRAGSAPSGFSYSNGNILSAPFSGDRVTFNASSTPYAFTSENDIDTDINIEDIEYDAESDSYFFFYGTEKFFNIDNTATIVLPNSSSEQAEIEIESNVRWKVSVTPESASEWIDISKKSGINSYVYPVKCLSGNATGVTRSAILTFTGNDISYNVEVVQYACNYSLSTETLNFLADGNQATVNITTNEDWQINVDAEWIDVQPASGTGNATITVTCAPNEYGVRSAVITFTGGLCNMPVTVSQAASKRTVALSVNNLDWGDVTGEGSYDYGTEVTVIAVPASNYGFVNWTENETEVSDMKEYRFNIENNRDLTANFALLEYNIRIRVTNSKGGIESAAITINDEIHLTTNQGGDVYVNLPNGVYSLLVEKEGYISSQTEFTVNGINRVVRIKLVLDESGINNLSAVEFDAFPNPAVDKLTIVRKSAAESAVEIFAMTGEQLLTYAISGTTAQIDISPLKQGAYLIKVTENETVGTKILIKK
ncbi:MAG: M6 family metalloprotease domain-containing protein [Cytophagaceae bacterium]|jgi:M6 family metalloprotease-like protein|nr:M6 family metalloprotease domain-containing protein [Cytophagaceae bacterium]